MPASASPNVLASVCVYCGSSDAADEVLLAAAARLGRIIASEGLRLVYGGGGVGLMGACARAAHQAGGAVLGVIPRFLVGAEAALAQIETVVVESMHERKIRMFEEADAFAVLPGAIGTLEEAIELIS
ncbi:MAG TPA: TIGR00730 family Rossman fold protein, partial [Caulobacteraceae bacterium]|nr:TIGR00730 family Rossman fold protein [Caulobacteraceae bacterium]